MSLSWNALDVARFYLLITSCRLSTHTHTHIDTDVIILWNNLGTQVQTNCNNYRLQRIFTFEGIVAPNNALMVGMLT